MGSRPGAWLTTFGSPCHDSPANELIRGINIHTFCQGTCMILQGLQWLHACLFEFSAMYILYLLLNYATSTCQPMYTHTPVGPSILRVLSRTLLKPFLMFARAKEKRRGVAAGNRERRRIRTKSQWHGRSNRSSDMQSPMGQAAMICDGLVGCRVTPRSLELGLTSRDESLCWASLHWQSQTDVSFSIS